MARVWQSGWETNSSAASSGEWQNGTTFDTVTVRSGTYSGKCDQDTQFQSSAFSLATIIARDYVRFSALPASTARTFMRIFSDDAQIDAKIRSDGKVEVVRVGQGTDGPGTAVLSAGVWYRFELKAVKGATGSIELRIDGVADITATSVNTGTTNYTSYVALGPPGEALSFYHDDAAVDDTNFPGAGSIIQLIPNGDGTLNSWTSDGSSPHFDSGDDWPGAADDDTTYLYAPNVTDGTANFDLTSTPADFDAAAVNAIFTLIRARKEESVGAGGFPTIPTVAAGRVLSVLATNPAGTHTSPDLSSLTKNSGDLLIAIVITYDGNSTNAEFSSWGGSFTEFGDFATTTTMGIGMAYKFSTGSETGTFTVTSADTSANDSAFFLLSIAGAHASTPPEAGSYVTGTSAAADPGSFNPSGWDAENTLWIAVCGSGETGTGGSYTGVASAPANYGNYADTGISADVVGGVEGAVAFRQLNAASEDVGTFSVDVSNARNAAAVIAVRPPVDTADTVDLYTQLRRSDESTAITNELTVVTTAPTSYTTYHKLMTGTGSHTKAQWDAARLAIRQDYTQSGTVDTTSRLRVTAVAVSVDYIPGAVASAQPNRLTLLGVGA